MLLDHRISGYFQSSLLELASESLASIPRIRIVCNTEVSAEDVKTVRMATGARRKELEEGLLRLHGAGVRAGRGLRQGAAPSCQSRR